MTQGRHPKTAIQRELEDNHGHRLLPKNEPHAVAGLPEIPTFVTGEAKREWKRMGKQLVHERRMALCYKAVYTTYCVAWGRWVDAEKQLKKYGTVITTPTGFARPSPRLAIANTAQSQLMRAITELGISPTSQAKASTVRSSSTVTRLQAFLGGKTDSD